MTAKDLTLNVLFVGYFFAAPISRMSRKSIGTTLAYSFQTTRVPFQTVTDSGMVPKITKEGKSRSDADVAAFFSGCPTVTEFPAIHLPRLYDVFARVCTICQYYSLAVQMPHSHVCCTRESRRTFPVPKPPDSHFIESNQG
jgi:hypothetical protein